MIRNTDQRSKDYSQIMDKFRPGHADITYWQKYGIRDYRGGGRSSARETTGYMVQMGPHKIDRDHMDLAQVEENPFWTPDVKAAEEWPSFNSNHAGGVLGGISTGQDIVARFAVKPTSSILSPRKTIDKSGAETEIITKGPRHDRLGAGSTPCRVSVTETFHIDFTGSIWFAWCPLAAVEMSDRFIS